MMRRAFIALFQAIVPDQAAAEAEEFRRLWNDFAHTANKLMEGQKLGLWDVRLARKAEDLFDRVRRHPAWRVTR